MKKLFAVVLLIAAILCTGCGANTMAHNEAGEKVVDLPPGKKLVSISADSYDDYYICREMKAGEQPEEYTCYPQRSPDKRTVIREHAKR